MALKDIFSRFVGQPTVNLKQPTAQQRQMVIDLFQQTERLTQKDVASWRMAWQRALDVENPKRLMLYNVYTDVEIDPHLTGCIAQRKGFATKRAFRLVDKDGKENIDITKLFEQEWFDQFLSLVMDSRFFGHSLIQFGSPVVVDGIMRFSSIELVPRRHVVPEYGSIIRNQNDDARNGLSYREGKLAEWVIEAGTSHDLGLLLKCAPNALSKKNMLAFWDGFGEIFGMPIRIAKTTSQNQKDIDRVEDMLRSMGAAFWGVFQEGTEIDIKESSRGDAYNVYDRRIDRANSEISKCILNQTMTIDSGSSLSQSEVHLEVLENVVANDEKFLRNTVNNRLIPFMARHGFPVEGYAFDWNPIPEYNAEQIMQVEQMLINGGYDIDPQYFIDKYSITVTGKSQPDPNRFFD